jgi:hypothetical protein
MSDLADKRRATSVAWFAKPLPALPALFHMVLAGYVLTLGHYHRRHD